MVLVTGDPNQRHDVDGLPLLGPVLFTPFAFGVWRAWRLRSDHAYAALLIGLIVFLIPPLVGNEGGAPHFLRTLGMAPFYAALIGVGFLELRRAAEAVAATRGLQLITAASAVALVTLGLLSITTYLARSVSARYDAYSFAVVQLAAAADRGAGTVAIIDDYNGFDVRFLDYDQLPTLVTPGTRLRNPGVYSLVVALTQRDIAQTTDAATASRAQVVARDPQGRPAVWEVVP